VRGVGSFIGLGSGGGSRYSDMDPPHGVGGGGYYIGGSGGGVSDYDRRTAEMLARYQSNPDSLYGGYNAG
jgi:hypothetical protein